MPVLREIGCNKDNSIILDFDLKNLNVYNIYDNRNNFNFDYQPPKSDFERVLEKGERNMKQFKVKSLIDYYDIDAKVNRKINDIFEVDEQRYQYLKNHILSMLYLMEFEFPLLFYLL